MRLAVSRQRGSPVASRSAYTSTGGPQGPAAASYGKANPDALPQLPLGSFAVTTTLDADIPPGIVFCLRAVDKDGTPNNPDTHYTLAPHYLAHVGTDAAVLLPYPQAKRILDQLKRLALGRTVPGRCRLRNV